MKTKLLVRITVDLSVETDLEDIPMSAVQELVSSLTVKVQGGTPGFTVVKEGYVDLLHVEGE